ncbi:putative TetR family transcriptional regulator [Gordonia namibiensis NBRC 108229]|uniref:Putative TetR family transcriptional regulator n=1 Tax=Gordonia namibiensis NBRC 108229 TaxID=1208314 RepID=K6WKI5_9ACTN|nr:MULTISPECIES: TetR/AcrR family transcriptional regulator [Gordonia]MCK8612876.1 TetR/AcrR family transcriptional regulator [Gordonia sp. C13]GAB99870.1 putative TetR family transcriptional regulator [Gordonia namibiensis NBRC 108229]
MSDNLVKDTVNSAAKGKGVRSSNRKVRNTASPADQEAAILAAAGSEFAEVGVRRANIDEVAARAGVSRSTLYRRFPNKEALLYAVANDAYERGMKKLEESVKGMGPKDALVEAFAVGAELVKSDPLLSRIVLTDSEIKSVTAKMTSLFIDMVTDRVAATLRDEGAQMPVEDLLEAVEIHVRLVISLLETPPSDPARTDPQQARAFATKFLAPMIW